MPESEAILSLRPDRDALFTVSATLLPRPRNAARIPVEEKTRAPMRSFDYSHCGERILGALSAAAVACVILESFARARIS